MKARSVALMNEIPLDVETIFHQALKRESGAQRDAFLDGACRENTSARARVEALLAAHEEAQDFLEPPADGSGEEPLAEGPGSRIGPYKLLQQIGEGGMGVVYMAEQEEPVRRKVALKIIKLGMDTRQVIARFEAERQALALMDHTNIAHVLDAGATSTGRPYFVMELVRGISITEYCDTQNSDTEERLQLFIDVCRAVQHAHQKGIIHRDLKPSNVLVTNHDGKPVPKIIDFGVAKATNQRLTEKTLFTEFQQFIGTPEYMSPEQAEMSGLDVDTRTDVYSLGVLLYQLLTGTTPVDGQILRERGLGELTRILREEEPTAPSTQVSRLGERSKEIARQRATEPGALARLFRGDLDWIVMKALEKDRTRRYETAAALAEDVERHLTSQPVLAGPPSTAYKLRKFIHRNRKIVLAGSVAATILVLGLIGTSLGFVSARREAARSKTIADNLHGMLASFDPAQAAALSIDLESMRRTARDVFGDDHAAVAASLNTLAIQFDNSGNFDEAEPLYREALTRWEGMYGRSHLNVGITCSRLGTLLHRRGDDEAAEKALRDGLGILEALPGTPSLATCDAAESLADLLESRGEYDEAIALLNRSLEIRRASPSGQAGAILHTLERLFVTNLNGQRLDDVTVALRELYDHAHRVYPEGLIRSRTALTLGSWLAQRGDHQEAEPFLREALATYRKMEEPPRLFLLTCLDGIFQSIRHSTEDDVRAEADAILEEVIELVRPLWTPQRMASSLGLLGSRYMERELYFEALQSLQKARALVQENPAIADRLSDINEGILNCALFVAQQGEHSPSTIESVLAAVDSIDPGKSDSTRFQWTAARGGVLHRLGRFDEGIETLEPLLDLRLREFRVSSQRSIFRGRAFLALSYARLGRLDEARTLQSQLRQLDIDDGGQAQAQAEQLLSQLGELLSEEH